LKLNFFLFFFLSQLIHAYATIAVAVRARMIVVWLDAYVLQDVLEVIAKVEL